MPNAQTAFFGRQDPRLEPLYEAAMSNLSREHYVAFRDARAAMIQQQVETFLGIAGVNDLPTASR